MNLRRHAVGAMSCALTFAFAWPAAAAAPADPPTLDPDARMDCVVTPDGRRVRLQCTPAPQGGGRCLYAVECDAHADDQTCRTYERARGCYFDEDDEPGATWATRTAEGYDFVAGRVPAPPGWYRDAEGRALQVDFDLNERFWLGARWLGAAGPGGHSSPAAVGLETGLRVELFEDLDARYRFHALESEVQLNPFAFRGTVFRYDSSARDDEPFVRISTFWPEPKRHDVYLDVGGWFELLSVEHRPRQSVDETHLRVVGIGTTWDLWSTPDMTSYLRLRAGLALDDLFRRGLGDEAIGTWTVSPLARFEGDFTLDRPGHHHLTFGVGYDALVMLRRGDGDDRGDVEHRARAELAYELVVLAVNDQPVTLRAAVEGGWRDDLVSDHDGWDVRGGVGLRVSLIAPPRDHERAAEAERHALERRRP